MKANPTEMTKKLLFGQSLLPFDLNELIRPDGTLNPIQEYNMVEYLQTGAGRYARPSGSPLVSAFFENNKSGNIDLKPGIYSVKQLNDVFQINDKGIIAVSQYKTDVWSDDFALRSYLFGSTLFGIKNIGGEFDGLKFNVSENGDYSISGLELVAYRDDFDFQSNSLVASTANVYLNSLLNPYDLIPLSLQDKKEPDQTLGVKIEYTGPGLQYENYTYENYLSHKAASNLASSGYATGIISLLSAGLGEVIGSGLVSQMIEESKLLDYKTDDGKLYVLGDDKDNKLSILQSKEITELVRENSLHKSVVLVGGDGNDFLLGNSYSDELWGGRGNDKISAYVGSHNIAAGIFLEKSGYISSGEGDDSVEIGKGNHIVELGGGDDVVHLNPTNFRSTDPKEPISTNIIWGGAGKDKFYFNDSTSGWTIALVYDENITSKSFKDVDIKSVSDKLFEATGVYHKYIIINPEANDEFYRPDGKRLAYEVRSGEREHTSQGIAYDPNIKTGRVETNYGPVADVYKYATWGESTTYEKFSYYALTDSKEIYSYNSGRPSGDYSSTPNVSPASEGGYANLIVGTSPYSYERIYGVTNGVAGIRFDQETYVHAEKVIDKYYELKSYTDIDQTVIPNGKDIRYDEVRYSPFNPKKGEEKYDILPSYVPGDVIWNTPYDKPAGGMNKSSPSSGKVGDLIGSTSTPGYDDNKTKLLINPGFKDANKIYISLNDLSGPSAKSVDRIQPYLAMGDADKNLSTSFYSGKAQFVIDGTSSDDTLIGKKGSNLFRPGLGNDGVLSVLGTGTISYKRGDGADYVLSGSASSNDLQNLLFEDITRLDVSIARDGVDLIVSDVFGGGSITYFGHFVASSKKWGLDSIIFQDGFIMSRSEIDAAVFSNERNGTVGNDNLIGTSANELISGFAGDDTIMGGDGADTLDGGSGTDTADYSDKTTSVAVVLNGSNNATVSVDGAAEDTIRNIENLLGGSGNDAFTGDDLANSLTGGGGNDTLKGSDGNDTLSGGAGADVLDGGAGIDTVSYDGSYTGVTVRLWASGEGGDAQGDVYVDVEAVTGSSKVDFISGQDHVDELLKGGADDDELYGFGGNDTLDGGTGSDFLQGGFGNDSLLGGDGDDALNAYHGDDVQTGGAGNDTFLFDAGFGKDVITDFTVGTSSEDLIQFDRSIFASYSAVYAAAAQIELDVVITIDNANTLTLKNVALSNLHVDDFRFV